VSAYIGAASITDKHGRALQPYQVTTLETDENGTERLGWALVAGRDLADACRRARRLWPWIHIVGSCEAPQS
jgi:hypothetical protein